MCKRVSTFPEAIKVTGVRRETDTVKVGREWQAAGAWVTHDGGYQCWPFTITRKTKKAASAPFGNPPTNMWILPYPGGYRTLTR